MARASSNIEPCRIIVSPKKTGEASLVVLSDNVERYEEDGLIMYSRDQYEIETEYRDGIEREIEENFGEWVQKGIDAERAGGMAEADAKSLEAAVFRIAVIMAAALPDEQAAEVKALFTHWAADTEYKIGDRRRHEEGLYKCLQNHISQSGWTPDATPAIWALIDGRHAGTAEEPIPAAFGLTYEPGLYYSEDGAVYRCTWTSAVTHYAHLPSALAGAGYFEVVTS